MKLLNLGKKCVRDSKYWHTVYTNFAILLKAKLWVRSFFNPCNGAAPANLYSTVSAWQSEPTINTITEVALRCKLTVLCTFIYLCKLPLSVPHYLRAEGAAETLSREPTFTATFPFFYRQYLHTLFMANNLHISFKNGDIRFHEFWSLRL